MAFESINALLAMGGHGPYVWTSYGAFLLVLSALVIWSVWQRRLVIEQARWHQRVARVQQQKAAGRQEFSN
ncbi:heme exporter protein CcmD [Tamilnaduibacter salinus]|uniref:Heme exporter protein D n=1 Tax=Tamilnaduibacter salinus TaxID=1484056 RepID=A0A2A2I344_9GAMM|nr:heme exporter protein CcmD [Tamilnaduibacter salinus]PAV26441.1 heme exporter protein CcmD [Tamilnaduibacter salinus]PVY79286.1 heme exporter protein CcmD [Tamilnaduibacter salinus]